MEKIAVIFDLDGTLLDTLEDLTDSTNYVMEQMGFPKRTLAEIREFIGNGAKRLFHQAVPAGTPMDVEQEAVRLFQSYYKDHCQIKTKLYPGIAEMLNELQLAGYPVGIVSNKPDYALQELAKQHFPGIYAKGESHECPRKPAPDMIFAAAKALNRKPEQCIYVGDSDVDVVAARNAGMECLSVLWGFRDEPEIRAAGGTHFCHSAQELLEKVKEMETMIHGK